MPLKSSGDLVLRLQKVEQAATGKTMKPRITEIGVKLKPLARQAAAVDLGGDAAFSGWPKAGPLEAQFKLHQNGQGLTMFRGGRSAGPWRVAESGRNPFIGPFKPNITKTGKLAKRQRTRSRYNGTTKGKNTWSDATALMGHVAPGMFRKAQTKAVLDAFLGK